MKRIDWSESNGHWGQAGHNVHESETGSWVTSVHGQEQAS